MRTHTRRNQLMIMLISTLLFTTTLIIHGQEDDTCDIDQIKTEITSQLDDVESIEDLTQIHSALGAELNNCGVLATQLPEESIWQLHYESGNPWLRQCPDGQEIAYPGYEITITRDGNTLSNSIGGTLEYVGEDVYLLTAPYTLRNTTIISERWQVIDEAHITGTSWDYYPDLNCLLHTTYVLDKVDNQTN